MENDSRQEKRYSLIREDKLERDFREGIKMAWIKVVGFALEGPRIRSGTGAQTQEFQHVMWRPIYQ